VLYWEEKELHINTKMDTLWDNNYDVIVITTGHRDYRGNPAFLQKLMQQPSAFIYDTIGVLTNEEIQQLSARHTVKVIGRGDL
jgi:UDP-N-acetyl-D-mannosaminuronate dehydrogenase